MNSQPSRFSVVGGEKDGTVEQKNSNMKVVVRVRPPNERELSQGKVNVIKVIDNYMLTFDPKEDDLNQISNQKNRMSVLDKRIRDLSFAFDRVFNDQATNEEVFEHTTKPVVESVLDGYNCSVFAYGATSAGKTHTMLGSPNNPGVIFLTMMELYRKLMEKDEEYETDISVSYLEIYNETCKDLLLPTGPLAVREDPDKGVCVAGLSLHKPRSAEELLEMLHFGNQNRTQHPTDANKQSSRSHAVFQVFIRQCPKVSGISTQVKLSKMSLIDLAGSERATVTTNRGDRLREGANINKSLLALGNCINALAENKSNLHIPYRNSKLTRLLKDSLGGNCHTIMIAALSPSTLTYEDTYNTLKYANRAKNIKSSITANTINVDYHISQYAKIVEDLKAQICILQEKCENTSSQSERDNQPDQPDQSYLQFQRYSEELRALFKEKCLFLKLLVDCEAAEKELTLKLMRKERSYKRLEIIRNLSGDAIVHAHTKMENLRVTTTLKQSQYNEQAIRLKGSLQENKKRIVSLQTEIDEFSNHSSQVIRSSVNTLYESLDTELERTKLSTKYKHVKRHLSLQDTDQKNNERLISQLLEIIAAQQQKIRTERSPLKANTPGLLNRLQDLPTCLLEGPKISWADQTVSSEKEEELPEHQNMTFFLDFNSCTPVKTPLRKPAVLRQVIMETGNGLDNTTDFNTTMNAGPIRFHLPLAKVGSTENCSNVILKPSGDCNGTFIVSASPVVDDSRRKTYVMPSPPSRHDEHHDSEQESPVKEADKTYVCNANLHDTPPSSNDVMKSFIPMKAPLAPVDGNERDNTSTLTTPRMRSLTERYDTTFSTMKDKGKKAVDEKPTIVRHSSFNKSFLNKKRKLNLGTASRSLTNLHRAHKENVRPQRSGLVLSSRFGTAKSCTALNTKSTTKGRFRF